VESRLAYLYDGSFQGLLTAIYHAYYDKDDPVAILPFWEEGSNFLYSYKAIETDSEKWNKVYNAVQEKISQSSLRRIYNVYLSDMEDSGIIILGYLREGFRIGGEIDDYQTNPAVRDLEEIYHKVRLEVHRLLGLVRFKKLQNGIFYSQVEPDHNVVSLLAPHFVERIPSERWIIHDIKRGVAVFYDTREWTIRNIVRPETMVLCEEEEGYQDMWREYYRSATIQSRRNTRQQRAYMPVRYWKNLIEKGD
jgi:probable DNA metabolism protein